MKLHGVQCILGEVSFFATWSMLFNQALSGQNSFVITSDWRYGRFEFLGLNVLEHPTLLRGLWISKMCPSSRWRLGQKATIRLELYCIRDKKHAVYTGFAVFHVSPGKHHQISECCKALRICLPWLLKDRYGMDDGWPAPWLTALTQKPVFTMAFDHLHKARDLGLPESSMFDTSDLCLDMRKSCPWRAVSEWVLS